MDFGNGSHKNRQLKNRQISSVQKRGQMEKIKKIMSYQASYRKKD
jgi:hypothetical protein